MRRFALAVVVVAGLLLSPSPASAASIPDRAAVSYAALLRYLAVNDGSQLFHERYPVQTGDNPYSYEWPFSQVHGATLDLTGRPGQRYDRDLAARLVGQERYWNASRRHDRHSRVRVICDAAIWQWR